MNTRMKNGKADGVDPYKKVNNPYVRKSGDDLLVCLFCFCD